MELLVVILFNTPAVRAVILDDMYMRYLSRGAADMNGMKLCPGNCGSQKTDDPAKRAREYGALANYIYDGSVARRFVYVDVWAPSVHTSLGI